jgi:hypothetical protein
MDAEGMSPLLDGLALGPIAHPSGGFRFFDLPRELRDMIYDDLWSYTPKMTMSKLQLVFEPLVSILAQYEEIQIPWSTEDYPPWVQVSRAFRDEALEQYYRKMKWKATICGNEATPRIGLSSDDYVSNYFTEREWASDKLCYGQDYSRSANGIDEPPRADRKVFEGLEKALVKEDGRKTLYVNVGISYRHAQETLMIDLSAIEFTGFHVDRLVVHVMRIGEPEESNQLNELLVPVIKSEVKRLGSALISGPTSPIRTYLTIARPLHWIFEVSNI